MLPVQQYDAVETTQGVACKTLVTPFPLMITVIFLFGNQNKIAIQRSFNDFYDDYEKGWKETKRYILENGKRVDIKHSEIQAFYEANSTQPITERLKHDKIKKNEEGELVE